jgi:hypothetical protein
MIRSGLAIGVSFMLTAFSARVSGHSGPPYPILSDQVAGPYLISVWTDPDTTDDGSRGGQFWIRIHLADGGELPPRTQATVSIGALDRMESARDASASPVNGDITNQFAALEMDHEGSFGVLVRVEGPRGRAAVTSSVDATYDLRPSRLLFLVYLAPFVLVGLLWGRLLMRRRAMRSMSSDDSRAPKASQEVRRQGD